MNTFEHNHTIHIVLVIRVPNAGAADAGAGLWSPGPGLVWAGRSWSLLLGTILRTRAPVRRGTPARALPPGQ